MLPLNASAILAGQLLGAAFAAGLNLYATVAVVGAAARFNLVPPLPPGLRGLSNALVIGSAAGLFLAELVVEKIPVVGAIWTGAHAVIRPLAMALLTFLAFAEQPPELAVGLAAAAGLIAFGAHGVKTGLRVILASAPRRHAALHTAAAALALDLLAIATAVATLLVPEAAQAVGASALLLFLLAGPRLWRAAIFGGHALRARLAGFFGFAGWKTWAQLPRRIRRAVPPAAVGQGDPRGLRAAVVGLPGAAAYRTGWLVFDARGRSFIYRRLLSTRTLPLPTLHSIDVHSGPMVDVLRAAAGGDRVLTIFLLKDGPSTTNAVAELTH